MKAFGVRPPEPRSARVLELPRPEPRPGEALVEVLEVGICGTDAEINEGLYGTAPQGEEFLILGHEILGRLESGELVVPMVRRGCLVCSHCRRGEQDMCGSGSFSERGIKGIHGGICAYIAEAPSMLIGVPAAARAHAVLLEPMSVVAKGIRHALLIQKRFQWEPRRALVVGGGPIGLLATLALRALGWEVVTAARKRGTSAKSAVVAAAGASYHSVGDASLLSLAEGGAAFDFIFEASGSAEAAFDSMHLLALNGVLCLTSITGGSALKTVPSDRLNRDLVLGNKVVFGVVNANRQDFVEGLAYFELIEKKWPGALGKLLTHRVGFDNAGALFDLQKTGIKTVFQVSRD
ncbi:MAG: alcohol dehydrogenase catalytic domain-containing protein [Elusimicrobia bacterium]|nr:alcohol dehydrogenase catalytic domain-containing protein [Elusimicrobiota bacterium]